MALVSVRWNDLHVASEINELEMEALHHALSSLDDKLSAHRPILILMDNTSAIHTLARGAAHAYRLNQEALRVLQLLPADTSVQVGYIESTNNPADAASRGLTTDLSQLSSDLGSVGRRLAGSAVQVTVPSQLVSPSCKSQQPSECDDYLPCEGVTLK